MREFIKEQVSIDQLPSVDLAHKGVEGTQITIGDLHANAIKLIFMLVKHGIATNISEKNYNRLVEIYRTPTENLTKILLDEFNSILAQIEFGTDSLVRLIGDELADRGNNDYFTLKMLEKLNEHKVPVEILVSNHGIEFIEAYEKRENFNVPEESLLFEFNQAQSMINLQVLVEKGAVTREEVLKIIEKTYKPTLRAISYSLSDEKEITIYSHAAIGLNTIKSLAQKLSVEYKDETAIDLAQTIDSINEQFLKHVQNNTVNTLYVPQKMLYPDLDSPFEFIMWNRNPYPYNIQIPTEHSGYKVNFAHGHDSEDETEGNIYNLDNQLGKTEDRHKGDYTVLYSKNEITLVSKLGQERVTGNLPFSSDSLSQVSQSRISLFCSKAKETKDNQEASNDLKMTPK